MSRRLAVMRLTGLPFDAAILELARVYSTQAWGPVLAGGSVSQYHTLDIQAISYTPPAVSSIVSISRVMLVLVLEPSPAPSARTAQLPEVPEASQGSTTRAAPVLCLPASATS